jgi:hypothetical protein
MRQGLKSSTSMTLTARIICSFCVAGGGETVKICENHARSDFVA